MERFARFSRAFIRRQLRGEEADILPRLHRLVALGSAPIGAHRLGDAESGVIFSRHAAPRTLDEARWYAWRLEDADAAGCGEDGIAFEIPGLLVQTADRFDSLAREGRMTGIRLVPDDRALGPNFQLVTNGGFFMPANTEEYQAVFSLIGEAPECLYACRGFWNLPDPDEDVPLEIDQFDAAGDYLRITLAGSDTAVTFGLYEVMRELWTSPAGADRSRWLDLAPRRDLTARDG